MSFEQLAELRDRLRAEKEQVKADIKKPYKLMPSRQVSPREQDPAVEAIWRLQRHFPLAFPLSPAPKAPLKEGILKDAEQHLELLGISGEQLKQGLATWCRGSRYWASMTENAQRLDLSGQYRWYCYCVAGAPCEAAGQAAARGSATQPIKTEGFRVAEISAKRFAWRTAYK